MECCIQLFGCFRSTGPVFTGLERLSVLVPSYGWRATHVATTEATKQAGRDLCKAIAGFASFTYLHLTLPTEAWLADENQAWHFPAVRTFHMNIFTGVRSKSSFATGMRRLPRFLAPNVHDCVISDGGNSISSLMDDILAICASTSHDWPKLSKLHIDCWDLDFEAMFAERAAVEAAKVSVSHGHLSRGWPTVTVLGRGPRQANQSLNMISLKSEMAFA